MKSSPRQREVEMKSVLGITRVPLLLALFVAACSDSTGPAQVVRIVPAFSTVTLQTTPQGRTLNTSVVVTNTSAFNVSVADNCGVTLEKGGLPALPPGKTDWTTVWARICYLLDAVAQIPETSPLSLDFGLTLKPGQSITIPITAVVGEGPGFAGEPGQYRVRVPMAMNIFGVIRSMPPESSVSDTFTLTP